MMKKTLLILSFLLLGQIAAAQLPDPIVVRGSDGSVISSCSPNLIGFDPFPGVASSTDGKIFVFDLFGVGLLRIFDSSCNQLFEKTSADFIAASPGANQIGGIKLQEESTADYLVLVETTFNGGAPQGLVKMKADGSLVSLSPFPIPNGLGLLGSKAYFVRLPNPATLELRELDLNTDIDTLLVSTPTDASFAVMHAHSHYVLLEYITGGILTLGVYDINSNTYQTFDLSAVTPGIPFFTVLQDSPLAFISQNIDYGTETLYVRRLDVVGSVLSQTWLASTPAGDLVGEEEPKVGSALTNYYNVNPGYEELNTVFDDGDGSNLGIESGFGVLSETSSITPVPEFSTMTVVLAIVGALAAVLIIRKR